MRATYRCYITCCSILAAIALCFVFAAASGEDPLAGWTSLKNKAEVSVSGGDARELVWRYHFESEPSVLTRKAGEEWRDSVGLTFIIRSDRSGRLFLRIDQSDGGIFLASFEVTEQWREQSLAFDDFQPFGKTSGKIQPSRIEKIFLVDLNGSDGGAFGSRTIFVRQMVFHGRAMPVPPGSKRVPLVAFDAKGELLDAKQFRARGTSGGQWCYLSGPNGNAIPLKIAEETLTIDGQTRKVPVLVFDEKEPATLEILYWPTGDGYKLRLQADGAGAGLRNALRNGQLLVNLELARTRFQLLSRYAGEHEILRDLPLKELGQELTRVTQEPNLRLQAGLADALLLKMLDLSRDAVRRISRAMLAKQLSPGRNVTVPGVKPGELKAGSQVTLSLEDPAFHIGIGQGFGFVTPRTPPEQIDHYYQILRQAGFNMVTLPLYWDQVVDTKGRWQETLRFDTLARLGYSLHAHGFVQSGMPAAVRKLKGDKFLEAAKQHTAALATEVAKRYGDQIVLWQAINEPSSNSFGDSRVKERVAMVAELVRHMRKLLPKATIVVNDYDWERGIEAGEPLSARSIIGTLPFYRELMKTSHQPDMLALEWYPGARVERPEFRVDLAEPCMDLLDTSLYWDRFLALGRPLIFTESNFPGSMQPDDLNGYAWGRWTPESQADAAVDTLILAMSKPGVTGWVWWSITDLEPWNRNGGLFTSAGAPKPVFTRLSNEIQALRNARKVVVTADGKLPLPALPGIWKISANNGTSWLIRRSRDGQLSQVAHVGHNPAPFGSNAVQRRD